MASRSPREEPAPTLRITRTFAAPPEEVFRAWTEQKALESWFAPSTEYQTRIHDLDVRPGGRYRIEMKSPDGKTHIVGGAYREVSPPRRLVYTWRWETESAEMGEDETVVTLEMRPAGGGGTELVLTHERFPNAAARDEHNKGWNGCLDRLARYVA